MELFNQAIDDFPGLANYPRRELIEEAARSIKSLPEAEVRSLIDRVADEARRGLESEPENWRLMISLARFYHVAASTDESYARVAQRYLDDAVERAPSVVKMYVVSER